MRLFTKFSIVLFVFFTSLSLYAQPVLTQVLVGPGQDIGFGDSFGTHIESTPEWLVVAAPREDIEIDGFSGAGVGEQSMGAVYIYERTVSGLVLHQKLLGTDFAFSSSFWGARFGAGILIKGTWMFIGAANDNFFPGLVDPNPDPTFGPFFFSGKLFIFRYNAVTNLWEDSGQRLISHAPESRLQFAARTGERHVEAFTFEDGEDNFGEDDFDEDDFGEDDFDQDDPSILLVGEPNNVGVSTSRLNVFKLEKGVWERIQILNSPSGDPDSFFADDIASAGRYVLVSESGFDPLIDHPVVHVYPVTPNGIAKTNGVAGPIQTLSAPGGSTDTTTCGIVSFGNGLAAANGVAMISDGCDGTVTPLAGAVHVYSVSNGNAAPLQLVQTLHNPQPGKRFYGFSAESGSQGLSTDGQRLLVGSSARFLFAPTQELDVDLYERTVSGDFIHTESIATPDPGIFLTTSFGISVNLLGNNEFAIGRRGSAGEGGGKVYIYSNP